MIWMYTGFVALVLGLTPDMMTVSPPAIERVGIVYNDGGSATVKYLTGYLVEKSLAVDNIFVIAMIFGFFGVPPLYQHRVLFWGTGCTSSSAPAPPPPTRRPSPAPPRRSTAWSTRPGPASSSPPRSSWRW